MLPTRRNNNSPLHLAVMCSYHQLWHVMLIRCDWNGESRVYQPELFNCFLILQMGGCKALDVGMDYLNLSWALDISASSYKVCLLLALVCCLQVSCLPPEQTISLPCWHSSHWSCHPSSCISLSWGHMICCPPHITLTCSCPSLPFLFRLTLSLQVECNSPLLLGWDFFLWWMPCSAPSWNSSWLLSHLWTASWSGMTRLKCTMLVG